MCVFGVNCLSNSRYVIDMLFVCFVIFLGVVGDLLSFGLGS